MGCGDLTWCISGSGWPNLYSESWNDNPPKPFPPSFKMTNLCRVHVPGPPGWGVYHAKPVADSEMAAGPLPKVGGENCLAGELQQVRHERLPRCFPPGGKRPDAPHLTRCPSAPHFQPCGTGFDSPLSVFRNAASRDCRDPEAALILRMSRLRPRMQKRIVSTCTAEFVKSRLTSELGGHWRNCSPLRVQCSEVFPSLRAGAVAQTSVSSCWA